MLHGNIVELVAAAEVAVAVALELGRMQSSTCIRRSR